MLEAQSVSVDDLARDYSRRVYNLCRSVLGNDADAEDACQEVFLTLTRRRAELGGVRQMAAWVMKVAVLTCQYVRRKRGRALPAETEADAPGDPGQPLDAGEELARIRSAIGALPERYRTVLALHYQQGMRHEQIADVMGISRGALRVLLHRAVARLRMETRRR